MSKYNTPSEQPDEQEIQYSEITPLSPLPNYTLSTVCPGCGNPTYRHACKVRCARCGFMWDCSEL